MVSGEAGQNAALTSTPNRPLRLADLYRVPKWMLHPGAPKRRNPSTIPFCRASPLPRRRWARGRRGNWRGRSHLWGNNYRIPWQCLALACVCVWGPNGFPCFLLGPQREYLSFLDVRFWVNHVGSQSGPFGNLLPPALTH